MKKKSLVTRAISTIRKQFSTQLDFDNSTQYWIDRYKKGGNSGPGSYNHFAEFKSEVLNKFVEENSIRTILELGSGDGNQLSYFEFPNYKGFDISLDALELCRSKYKNDPHKDFFSTSEIINHKAELSLSLDVLFHLVEDETFEVYMNQLFDSSTHFVIIYSSNFDDKANYENHVRHRKFTTWVEKNQSQFKLIQRVPNKYPPIKGENKTTTPADFFIYKKSV